MSHGYRSHQTAVWSLITGIVLAGCDGASSSRQPPPLPVAKALHETGPETPAVNTDPKATTERNFNGAVFRVPGAWQENPRKSDMIIAEFTVPGSAGDGRLTLSTAGGDVRSNIDRWKGQFGRGADDPSPRESTLQVAGREAQFVELFGSYQGMEPGATRKPGQAMLGVVIPLRIAERETNYFVKLTGPRETLTDARETFVKFVESAQFKE